MFQQSYGKNEPNLFGGGGGTQFGIGGGFVPRRVAQSNCILIKLYAQHIFNINLGQSSCGGPGLYILYMTVSDAAQQQSHLRVRR